MCPGHDVFTLSVREPLPEEDLLAVLRIAREAHARRRGVAHVAEHHRLDVDRRARVVWDALRLSVVACSRRVEASEDGIDGQAKLVLWMLREGPVAFGDDILKCAHEFLEFVDAELDSSRPFRS